MRLITWIALVLTAAGCGESTGPLAVLRGLGSSLAPVDTVFASPLVRSLGIFRFSGPLPTPVAGGPLIPDSLRGRTLAFSCPSQHYAVTADPGAPATGVRLVLYQRAPDGSIACPAAAIGQLDVFDVSAPGTMAVRGVATGPGGGTALVDYTISHNVTDADWVASAAGFVKRRAAAPRLSGDRGAGLRGKPHDRHAADRRYRGEPACSAAPCGADGGGHIR